MEKISVSIIIPVYNTPINYFERCVLSIDQQTYRHFEVIVIDDGSKKSLSDQYSRICNRYNNVKYLYQENKGVSAARNIGVKNAVGDYIAFVDADDIVLPNFLEDGIRLIKKYDEPDFVAGEMSFIDFSDIKERVIQDDKGRSFRELKLDGKDIGRVKLLMSGISQQDMEYKITGSPCARLYKKSIASRVEFPEGITHWEDQIYNRFFLNNCQSAILTNEMWYCYCQNDFSAMHDRYNIKFIERSRNFWDIWFHLNCLEETKTRIAFEKKSLDFFYAAVHINIVEANFPIKSVKRMINELFDEPIFQSMIRNLGLSCFHSIYDKIRFILVKHRNYILIYLMVKIKLTLRGKVTAQ